MSFVCIAQALLCIFRQSFSAKVVINDTLSNLSNQEVVQVFFCENYVFGVPLYCKLETAMYEYKMNAETRRIIVYSAGQLFCCGTNGDIK